MEPVERSKKDLQGHKLFMIKERKEEYRDNYTNKQKERIVYTAYDVTDEELVEFTGASIMDVQSINDNVAQTILIETSKTGKQYWSFEEWETAPQPDSRREAQPPDGPTPKPTPEDEEGERRGKGKEMARAARELMGGKENGTEEGEGEQ